MLVDVVELDWHEHPRPREEVLAQVPVRGRIGLDALWTDRDLARPKVHAELRPFELETLYSASIRRWKGANILLAGWQRQPCKGHQTGGSKFPQRWWLRIVLDPALPPMSWNERRALRQRGEVSDPVAGPPPCPSSRRSEGDPRRPEAAAPCGVDSAV